MQSKRYWSNKLKILDKKNIKEIKINNKILGKEPIMISGPCSVEDHETMRKIVKELKSYGVDMIRAGAYKPRTSPYEFQGKKEEGLKILRSLKEEFDIEISTEILDIRDIEKANDIIDVYQVGSRNMYNYVLIEELAKTGKPIILKRAFSATVKEWLFAAEYILKEGNKNVILCERGIRTFETSTRNTLDLNSVSLIHKKYNIPVLVDPSHGTGNRDLVYSLALSGILAGASGLLIESHIDPNNALSDKIQTVDTKLINKIMQSVKEIWKYR